MKKKRVTEDMIELFNTNSILIVSGRAQWNKLIIKLFGKPTKKDLKERFDDFGSVRFRNMRIVSTDNFRFRNRTVIEL